MRNSDRVPLPQRLLCRLWVTGKVKRQVGDFDFFNGSFDISEAENLLNMGTFFKNQQRARSVLWMLLWAVLHQ